MLRDRLPRVLPGVRAAAPTIVPPPRASVDIHTVGHRFNFEWATSDPVEDLDTYWWWAVSIRVDPDEVIADDGEGNLWAVPFSTDGADTVTFGTPVRVRETFVPVAAAQRGPGAAANEMAARRAQRVAAAGLDRPTKPARPNPAASSGTTHEEEATMPPHVRALLESQGINPDTATSEQIQAATLIAGDPPETDPNPEAPETPGDADPPEPGHDAPGTEAPETPAAPLPAAASAGDPVLAARLDALEAQNRELLADREARQAADAAAATAARVEQVSAAIQDGRIRPADRDAWVERVSDADHGAAHAATLATLPRVVPIGSLARAAGADAASPTSDQLARVRASMGIRPRKGA